MMSVDISQEGHIYFSGEVPALIDELERVPRDVEHCTQRIELASAHALGALERALEKKRDALMKGSTIASLAPQIKWWAVGGFWARPNDPGFSVLLRIVLYTAQVQTPAVRRQ